MKLRKKRNPSAAGSFLCFSASSSSSTSDDDHPRNSVGSSSQISESEPDSATSHHRSSRSLARVFRSAAFVTALKRIDSRRRNRGRSISRKESEPSDERSVNASDESTDHRIFTASPSLSSSSSSSSSSLIFCSPANIPQPETKSRPWIEREGSVPEKPSREQRYYDPAMGLVFLVISLAVMVIFGRLCAILWTATWLYLSPRRRSKAEAKTAPEVQVLRPRVSEADEKKRVVLEGFLERNRSY